MKRMLWEKTEALWIVALIACVYIDLSYAMSMATCMLLLSVLSLGQPEAFRRSQAMMLSRGKVTFSHLLSLLLCAAATTGLALSRRFAVIHVALSGLCIAQLLAVTALRSKRRYALAAISDVVSATILLLPALRPDGLRITLLLSEGWALIMTLLSLLLSPRAAPSPGMGLIREVPGALFVQLYYPLLAGFSMMIFLSYIDRVGMNWLWEEHVAGYLAGLLMFTLFRPLFRREESDTPWILAILEFCAVIVGLIAYVRAGRAEEFMLLPLLFLFIAGGCALTVYYAPTWKNVVTEVLWIAAGIYGVMMWRESLLELVLLGVGVLLGVVLQIGGMRDTIHKMKLRRNKK